MHKYIKVKQLLQAYLGIFTVGTIKYQVYFIGLKCIKIQIKYTFSIQITKFDTVSFISTYLITKTQ